MKFLKIIAFLFSIYLSAQTKPSLSIERIRTEKISFFINHLELKPNQVEPFRAIYNKYRDKIADFRNIKYQELSRAQILNLSEEQAKKEFSKKLWLDKQIIELKKDMDNDLLKILTYKQLLLLNDAEHLFKKRLLNQLKN